MNQQQTLGEQLLLLSPLRNQTKIESYDPPTLKWLLICITLTLQYKSMWVPHYNLVALQLLEGRQTSPWMTCTCLFLATHTKYIHAYQCTKVERVLYPTPHTKSNTLVA